MIAGSIDKINFILSRGEKKRLLFILAGSVILAALETLAIGLIIWIINIFVNMEKMKRSGLLEKIGGIIGVSDYFSILAALIVTAIALFLFKSTYTVYITAMQKRIVNDIRVRITTSLLGSYLMKPYAFHLEHNSAVLFKNITTEVSQFCDNFLFSIVMVSAESVILFAIILLLVCLYPFAALTLIVIASGVMAGAYAILKKRIRSYAAQRVSSSDMVYKSGLEALQAVKEIKIYNAHDFFVRKYGAFSDEYADGYVKFNIASDAPRHILESMLWTTVLAALLVSIYAGRTSSELIPVMTAFGLAALRILPSINRIYTHFNTIRYYSNGVDILYKILKEEAVSGSEAKDGSGDLEIADKGKGLRIEALSFRYKAAAEPIFRDLNMRIPGRKMTAIAGQTGAGKSTLGDIIMGLLEPDSGRIYYGETLITPERMRKFRRRIGYIPQHIFLVDDTLEANIAFGVEKEKIDRERVARVIETASLRSFVDSLPSGINTKVGERGFRISGGQRQRVAIARALYFDPEILIMDEATSALDGRTEMEINAAMRRLCDRLTVIIIAHRLSTIETADIIYVMDKGRIAASGSFGELAAGSDLFKKIAANIKATADEDKE